jgi:hypothetical protein
MATLDPHVFACPCGASVEIPLSISLGDRQPDGSVFAELRADTGLIEAHIAEAHGREAE